MHPLPTGLNYYMTLYWQQPNCTTVDHMYTCLLTTRQDSSSSISLKAGICSVIQPSLEIGSAETRSMIVICSAIVKLSHIANHSSCNMSVISQKVGWSAFRSLSVRFAITNSPPKIYIVQYYIVQFLICTCNNHCDIVCVLAYYNIIWITEFSRFTFHSKISST